MKPLAPLSPLPKPQWWAILLSLTVASAGWGAELGAWRHADLVVVIGTGMVLASVTLALRRLARQVGLPIVGPLCLLGAALLLLVLEPLCRNLAPPISLLLRPLGETAAALSVIWLLVNLNNVLVPKAPALKKAAPAAV
ncbi:hypothetical protein [Hymenobacter rubidus]|uniref:hypothetical protein n=1 Tax=Hymenobacter rubidus TaxID=1441626 RepID=UPI00191E6CAF|nr:hypothetical protein [Hymenobacter rubidus]